MSSLTGKTISSTYDGLLKTSDNDALGADAKEITDGLGNGSGVSLDNNGNVIAQGTVRAIGGIRDTSGDVGTSGKALKSTGSGTEWGDPVADNSITYAKLADEFTTSANIAASNIDFSSAAVFTKTLTGATTFTYSNAAIGVVKSLVINADGNTFTLPTGTKIVAGTPSTGVNYIQVDVTAAGEYWTSISQQQS